VLSSLVIEDLVVVGAAALLLTAAKSPNWVVFFIPCVMTVAGHAYFGFPAIGMAIYALAKVKLYRSGGSLIAIAIGHGIFDLLLGHVADFLLAGTAAAVGAPLLFRWNRAVSA
jgi:hypothetical protein